MNEPSALHAFMGGIAIGLIIGAFLLWFAENAASTDNHQLQALNNYFEPYDQSN